MKIKELIEKLEEYDTEMNIKFELDNKDEDCTYTNLNLINSEEFAISGYDLYLAFEK